MDNGLVASTNTQELDEFMKNLSNEFKPLTYFLGLDYFSAYIKKTSKHFLKR